MSDTPDTPPDAQNALDRYVPEEKEFKQEPAQAQPGQPPESMLGKRVAKARVHFALNVEALSRLTKLYDTHEGRGISPPSLSRYESGDTLPSAREVRLLCEALGVSAQWLIFGQINSSGESQQEQALLAALAAYVDMRKTDARIGDGNVSDMLKFGKDQDRARKLQEARKPQST